MTESIVEKLKAAHADNPEAIFSLFTLAGHVVSGRCPAASPRSKIRSPSWPARNSRRFRSIASRRSRSEDSEGTIDGKNRPDA